jgi:hypothetical protein
VTHVVAEAVLANVVEHDGGKASRCGEISAVEHDLIEADRDDQHNGGNAEHARMMTPCYLMNHQSRRTATCGLLRRRDAIVL